MGANSFGFLFTIHTFGESHGPAMGVVIDGCPSGVDFDEALLREDLAKRRPGQNPWVSPRFEEDEPEIISGVYLQKTLGTPITIVVRNKNFRPQDYFEIADKPRRGHTDLVWKNKFGHFDPRGGGRSSGRETIARVMAGSVAKMLLSKLSPSLNFLTYVEKIGPIVLGKTLGKNIFQSKKITSILSKAQKKGDSLGGVAVLEIQSPPPCLGEPVFHKLKAEMSSAFMGIGAVVAVELGAGVSASSSMGIRFHKKPPNSRLKSDPYGGIQGGISTGKDICMKIHFKPTSSILDVSKKGRHDPCIVPRALPVIEAMAAIVMANHILWTRLNKV